MKRTEPKPAYAIISQDGSRYTVVYYPVNCTYNDVSGYNYETILERVPKSGLTVIDWRRTTFEIALKFSSRSKTPRETDRHFGTITLAEYIDSARAAGAGISIVTPL